MAYKINYWLENPRTTTTSCGCRLQWLVGRSVWLLLTVLLMVAKDCSSQTDCVYLLNKPSGQISSPGFPEYYPDSVQCSWTIVMPEYERILITFVTFEVEKGTSSEVCDRDSVEILDGNKGTKSLGKYCNSPKRYPTGTISSTDSTVRVIFKSDSLNRLGFSGLFLANYQKQPCGDYLTGLKGEISSPNYPGPYPASKECIWRITVPSNMVIRFYFLDFALEPTSECNLDYIKLRDGLNVTSRSMGHFCAKRKHISEVRSTGNQMWLEFRSFKPTVSTGFHAFYEAESHCGGLLVGDIGSFTSPELPTSKTSEECTWKIQAGKGEIVSVVFSRFDVGSWENLECINDYVEFYDGADDQSKVLGRYCNMVRIPQDIRSSGKSMFVKLHRSVNARGAGFFATYTLIDPKNHYDKCSESAHELLYKCNNGEYIQCQWKCDGTDDCNDKSDENNCVKQTLPSKPSKLRSYVIILVSITGSAVAIVLIAFIVDRLRRKSRARARVRRRRRRRRLSPIEYGVGLLENTSEPSTPPPPYEFAASVSTCLDTSASQPPPYSSSEVPSQDAMTEDASPQELMAGPTEHQTRPRDVEANMESMGTGDSTVSESIRSELDNEDGSIGGSPPTTDTSALIS